MSEAAARVKINKLLDESEFPLIVLEVKSEDKNSIVGKEQTCKNTRSQNCRFVILSNGNQYHFWGLKHGNPHSVIAFLAPGSASDHREFSPDPQALIDEQIGDDYIVLTQRPNYAKEAAWRSAHEREDFIQADKLRYLRPYQLRAIHALQKAVSESNNRFLFEVATGTGKTLIDACLQYTVRAQNVDISNSLNFKSNSIVS